MSKEIHNEEILEILKALVIEARKPTTEQAPWFQTWKKKIADEVYDEIRTSK